MKKVLNLLFLLFVLPVMSQSIDLENLHQPNFKVGGAFSANTIFYESNANNGRDPFTYLLSGTLNFSAYNFNMPVTYSLTNQGDQLNYQTPFNFNRLSLAPKYKWIKAYIGDASMNFSPYTLSGHPFRGVGLELTPKGAFTISAMGGQLLKAVEAVEGQGNVPIFERNGYGLKIGFQKPKYKIEWIGFFAKDDINSIQSNFDEAGVAPQENIVNSLSLQTSLIKNVTFNVEYALSILSRDTRAYNISVHELIDNVLNLKENTSYLKAVKSDINYAMGKSNVGIRYERIDPNYTTLGALYMNNDLENIGVTFSRPFFNDRLNLATNIGYQRDDLKKTKKQDTKRVAGSANLSFRATDQLNITASYSNFTTYTNKNLNQFDYINEEVLIQADTLNYRQLSQNANLNMNYQFGKKKKHNFNLNYTIAGQANEQGGIIREGQASTVQNANLSHSVLFPITKFAINSSANYTLNTVANMNNASMGGSVSVTKKMFSDQLRLNVGGLYNQTQSQTSTAVSSVIGAKFNAAYTFLKKHHVTLSAIQMLRTSANQTQTQDLTVTLNYNYSF